MIEEGNVAIETMQYIFGTGVSELDDLVLNTLGTWAGTENVRMYRLFRCRRREKI